MRAFQKMRRDPSAARPDAHKPRARGIRAAPVGMTGQGSGGAGKAAASRRTSKGREMGRYSPPAVGWLTVQGEHNEISVEARGSVGFVLCDGGGDGRECGQGASESCADARGGQEVHRGSGATSVRSEQQGFARFLGGGEFHYRRYGADRGGCERDSQYGEREVRERGAPLRWREALAGIGAQAAAAGTRRQLSRSR